MWHREFRDYKTDGPNVKQVVEPSRGIYGCEMHEINDWGNTIHHHRTIKKGFFATLVTHFFGPDDKGAL